jgi:hypothetical protein
VGRGRYGNSTAVTSKLKHWKLGVHMSAARSIHVGGSVADRT